MNYYSDFTPDKVKIYVDTSLKRGTVKAWFFAYQGSNTRQLYYHTTGWECVTTDHEHLFASNPSSGNTWVLLSPEQAKLFWNEHHKEIITAVRLTYPKVKLENLNQHTEFHIEGTPIYLNNKFITKDFSSATIANEQIIGDVDYFDFNGNGVSIASLESTDPITLSPLLDE